MLHEPTVLILGAGASLDYQLPLGSQLKNDIISMCNVSYENGYRATGDRGGTGLFSVLQETHPKEVNDFLHAAWQIRDGLTFSDSIDAFVEQHNSNRRIVEMAKYCIAYQIVYRESQSCLKHDDHHKKFADPNQVTIGWYHALWRIITNGVPKEMIEDLFSPNINPLTVISFNYDRTFEQFIYHALQKQYAIDAAQAKTVLAPLNIIHPYGKIAPLPWQIDDLQKNYEFGNLEGVFLRRVRGDEVNIFRIAANIDTYSEAKMKEPKQTEIKNKIKEAAQIYFIGFAFHPQNTELIMPPRENHFDEKNGLIAATGFGMSKTAAQSITENMLNKFLLPKNKEFIHRDLKANNLMVEYEYPLREYRATATRPNS